MGAQAVLLGIVLCVEDDSTSESREPKNGGKQNAFVLLPSGHGGSRILSFAPYMKQRDSNFTCPVILFRITGWGTFPGADGRPVAERVVRRVSESHKPRPSKLKNYRRA